MVRHVSQQAFLKILSLRHTGAVCLTPAQRANIDSSSLRLLSNFSSFRSEFPKKLIDNPVWFRFHEAQRMSNLHSTPGDGIRP